MRLYNELTTEEQVQYWKDANKRIGYRNLWLECESDSLKAVIRDQRKEIEVLHQMLLEEFQKSAEKA